MKTLQIQPVSCTKHVIKDHMYFKLVFDVPSKWSAMSRRARKTGFHGLSYWLDYKYPPYERYTVLVSKKANQSEVYRVMPQEGNEYISIPASVVRDCIQNYFGIYIDRKEPFVVYEKWRHQMLSNDSRLSRTKEYADFQLMLKNLDNYSKEQKKIVIEAAINVLGKRWVALELSQIK